MCLQGPGATMPASLLWAVDVYGRVYSLSTAGQQWEQCHDAHMEFKRVTAAQQCCWGIACDNNIYLNVHASDLPVRYQEDTYENQVSFMDQLECQSYGTLNMQESRYYPVSVQFILLFTSPPDWGYITLTFSRCYFLKCALQFLYCNMLLAV